MHNAACVDGGEDGDDKEWKRRPVGFESKVDETRRLARTGHHGPSTGEMRYSESSSSTCKSPFVTVAGRSLVPTMCFSGWRNSSKASATE